MSSVCVINSLLCIILLQLILILNAQVANNGLVDHEGNLLADLQSRTGKYTRPIADPKNPVYIYMDFQLARIHELDERHEVLTSFGWIYCYWYNPFFVWDPVDYGGADMISVPSTEVWVPEIGALNSVEQGNDLSLDTKFQVRIESTGRMLWAPGFRWVTSCSINLILFPFDSQYCSVAFANWMHSAKLVYFVNVSDVVDIDFYEENGAWQILSTLVGVDVALGIKELTPRNYTLIYFDLYLRRRSGYFVLSYILPIIIVTIMSLLVFLLPPEAGEKMSVQITVFLGYSVLMLMLTDISPKSSINMPLVGYYAIICMGLTGASLLFSVIVLNAYHSNPEHPPAQWIRCIFLRGLGRILLCRNYPKWVDCKANEITDTSDKTNSSILSPEINKLIRILLDKEEKQQMIERNQHEFKMLAAVLDRLFFILFLITILAITLAVFLTIKPVE